MEILVELIGAALEALFGIAMESSRVPRIIKSVLTSLLLVPFIVIILLFLIRFVREPDMTGIILTAFCLILVTLLYARGLYKIWKH